MSYYSGDYIQGGYPRGVMRGDPGFFSFLGGLAKKAVGFIPGAGPIVSGALSAIPSGSKMKAIKAVGGKAIQVVKKHPYMTAAGAAATAGAIGGGMALAHHPGMGGRRHRRMRVTNPKALRRAIRRTQGFAKLAMRTIHLVHPKKKARFGGFRKRTRKAA
jgi:hypothetical protein